MGAGGSGEDLDPTINDCNDDDACSGVGSPPTDMMDTTKTMVLSVLTPLPLSPLPAAYHPLQGPDSHKDRASPTFNLWYHGYCIRLSPGQCHRRRQKRRSPFP